MSLRLGFYASLMSFANLLGFCLSEKLESFQMLWWCSEHFSLIIKYKWTCCADLWERFTIVNKKEGFFMSFLCWRLRVGTSEEGRRSPFLSCSKLLMLHVASILIHLSKWRRWGLPARLLLKNLPKIIMRPCIIFYRNDEDDVRGLLRLMGHVRFAYKWKDPMLLHFMFQVVCIVSNHVTTISQMFVKKSLIGNPPLAVYSSYY